jgi:hypothetical protein
MKELRLAGEEIPSVSRIIHKAVYRGENCQVRSYTKTCRENEEVLVLIVESEDTEGRRT